MKHDDHDDEQILQTLKKRLVDPAEAEYYNQHVRNLSVDVLANIDRRHASKLRRRALSWSVASMATAGLIYILVPFSTTRTDGNQIAETAVASTPVTTSEMAAEYVDAMVDDEAIDLLADRATANPILLNDDDIDMLFKDL